MIEVRDFLGPLLERGYDFWTGVPCSFLQPIINCAIQSPDLTYVGSSSEGEAIGLGIGAHLAGHKTVAICQNAGLGNMVNPLTSLNYPFRIPTLIIVTHRGALGLADEPQHSLMGLITEDLLKAMQIPWEPLDAEVTDIAGLIDEADRHMKAQSLSYAFIIKKGTFAPCNLSQKTVYRSGSRVNTQGSFSVPAEKRIRRCDAIQVIRNLLTNGELIVGSTGKIGRELFSLGHSSNQFYVLGGMGCASAIGLGLSLCQRKHRLVVLDGDGAALMNMGALATIGHCHPDNLIHVILDNEAHESTGGQPTASGSIDFADIASACSYGAVFRCDSGLALTEIVNIALNSEGPVLIHVKVALGSDPNLGRPTLSPMQMKEQFMRHVAG